MRVRGSMDSEQKTPNVINIQTKDSPSPVKREFNELNADFYTLKHEQSPRGLQRQRYHQASYAAEDFKYNEKELAKLYIAKKGPGGLNYRVDKGKKGEVIVNMPFLMKLFHDSIDYDRIIEIDKQELVLQPDYNPFLLYRLFTGGQDQYLSVSAFSQLLETHFGIAHSFLDISVMLQRQLPTYQPEQGSAPVLTYTDFLSLLMPKNQDFAAFVKRKLRDDSPSGLTRQESESNILARGVSEDTHEKLRKLFLDALVLENELER